MSLTCNLILWFCLFFISILGKETYIEYKFTEVDERPFPKLSFSTNLTEDFSKQTDGSYAKVDAYRVIMSSLKTANKPDDDDYFIVKMAFDEDDDETATLRYLDTSTGDLKEVTFEKSNPTNYLNISATSLGEGSVSINANQRLYCNTLLIRAESMPLGTWYIVQPDFMLHHELEEATAEKWVHPTEEDSEVQRTSMFPPDTPYSTIDSLAKSVSSLMKATENSSLLFKGGILKHHLSGLSPKSDLHFELDLAPLPAPVSDPLPHQDDDQDGHRDPNGHYDENIEIPNQPSSSVQTSPFELTFVRHTYHSIRNKQSVHGPLSRRYRRGLWDNIVKIVEKGAKDIANEVVKMAESIKSITCKTVSSFVQVSQDFFKYPVKYLISSIEGGFIAVIINSAKEAISTVIESVNGAVRLVESMFTKVALSMGKVIDFFKFFFSWRDVIKTQKVFAYTFAYMPSIVSASTRNFYTTLNHTLDDLENKAISSINNTFPHVEEKYIDFEVPINQDVQTNGNKYLMNLIIANQHKVIEAFPENPQGSPKWPPETSEMKDSDDAKGPNMDGILQDVMETMASMNASVSHHLEKEPNFFRLMKNNGKQVFGDVLRSVVRGSFSIADKVIKGADVIIKHAVNLLKWLFRIFFAARIKIPVISDIWWNLTRSELTVASLFGLFAAIPSVLLSKTICGRTLVPDSMVHFLSSWSEEDFFMYLTGQVYTRFSAHLFRKHNNPVTTAFDYLLNAVVPMFQTFINLIIDGVHKITRMINTPLRRLMRRIPLVPASKYSNVIDWLLRAVNMVPPVTNPKSKTLSDLLWVNYGVNWAIMAIQLQSHIAAFDPINIPSLLPWTSWGYSVNGVTNVVFAIVSGVTFRFDDPFAQKLFDLDMSMKGLGGVSMAMLGPNMFLKSPYIWLAQDAIALTNGALMVSCDALRSLY